MTKKPGIRPAFSLKWRHARIEISLDVERRWMADLVVCRQSARTAPTPPSETQRRRTAAGRPVGAAAQFDGASGDRGVHHGTSAEARLPRCLARRRRYLRCGPRASCREGDQRARRQPATWGNRRMVMRKRSEAITSTCQLFRSSRRQHSQPLHEQRHLARLPFHGSTAAGPSTTFLSRHSFIAGEVAWTGKTVAWPPI